MWLLVLTHTTTWLTSGHQNQTDQNNKRHHISKQDQIFVLIVFSLAHILLELIQYPYPPPWLSFASSFPQKVWIARRPRTSLCIWRWSLRASTLRQGQWWCPFILDTSSSRRTNPSTTLETPVRIQQMADNEWYKRTKHTLSSGVETF